MFGRVAVGTVTDRIAILKMYFSHLGLVGVRMLQRSAEVEKVTVLLLCDDNLGSAI
jgi:hypothetical protein